LRKKAGKIPIFDFAKKDRFFRRTFCNVPRARVHGAVFFIVPPSRAPEIEDMVPVRALFAVATLLGAAGSVQPPRVQAWAAGSVNGLAGAAVARAAEVASHAPASATRQLTMLTDPRAKCWRGGDRLGAALRRNEDRTRLATFGLER
jgi:hypothetical protein